MQPVPRTATVALAHAWRHVRARAHTGHDQLTVVPYTAHGNRERLIARGRVLADAPAEPVRAVQPLYKRIGRMARRFMTDEVPGVRIRVAAGEGEGEGVSDREGYYRVEVHGHGLPADRLLHELTVAPVDHDPEVPLHVRRSRAMIPTPQARRLIVSDIDDTIMRSQATSPVRFYWSTLSGSSWTRQAFDGTAELFEGLQRGPGLDEDNPVVYLSSSAWNIHDFLEEFLARSAMPVGPLLLREVGGRSGDGGHHDAHKRAMVEELLDVHDLPLVLIGDTGQRDAWIYRDVVASHPGRIEAVLLRHVMDDARRAEVESLWADVDDDVVVAVSDATTPLATAVQDAGLIGPGWADRVNVEESAAWL